MQKDILINEISKVIVGKKDIIEKILVCLLADGHILLEDLPGTGKTNLALAISKIFDIDHKRLQLTSDTLPSDITGYMMYDKDTHEFRLKKGPIFTNLLLADEINRTSPKTQSALLEVMEEKQVTIDARTYELEDIFVVIATQNPYGAAGTNLLPQSQMDRFMMVLSLGYPDLESEKQLFKDRQAIDPLDEVLHLVRKENLKRLQDYISKVYVHDDIYDLTARLSKATREDERILVGASPRAGLALIKAARARAILYERDYVTMEDIDVLYQNIYAHRVILKDQEIAVLDKERLSILDDIYKNLARPDIKDR